MKTLMKIANTLLMLVFFTMVTFAILVWTGAIRIRTGKSNAMVEYEYLQQNSSKLLPTPIHFRNKTSSEDRSKILFEVQKAWNR